MKIDVKRMNDDLKSDKKERDIPILPLVPTKYRYRKDEILTFKLRTEPANADSPTYDFTTPYLNGTEEVRVAIDMSNNYLKIRTGLNIQTGEGGDAVVKRILKDTALSSYSATVDAIVTQRYNTAMINAQRAQPGDTDAIVQARINAVARIIEPDDVVAGIQEVIQFMSPYKALSRVKRYLRRNCRKPADMNVRTFYNHFQRINHKELPMLPPFGTHPPQSLHDDETLDIMLFAFPKSWQAEMQRQGYDPFEHSSLQLLNFCERLEAAEKIETPVKTKQSHKSSDSKKQKTKSSESSKKSEKYCQLHGHAGHTTNECRTIQAQVKKLKGSSDDGPSKNKTWSRKADNNQKKFQKELQAFVKKAVSHELNAFSDVQKKKRKVIDDDDDDSSNSSHSNESINMIEGIDLSKMDFDMDSKKKSEDDSSVETGEYTA